MKSVNDKVEIKTKIKEKLAEAIQSFNPPSNKKFEKSIDKIAKKLTKKIIKSRIKVEGTKKLIMDGDISTTGTEKKTKAAATKEQVSKSKKDNSVK